jgi:hypothetical protein
MPVSEAEFAALRARVQRLEILVRQLQNALPPLRSSQEMPDGR